MQKMKNGKRTDYSTRLKQVSVIMICIAFVLGLNGRMLPVSGQTVPKILVFGQTGNSSPNDTLIMKVNQTFTMTVNMTDFTDLFAYEVAFKYNQTVLNMTSITVPANSVYAPPAVSLLDYLAPFNQSASSLIDLKDGRGVGVVIDTFLGFTGVDISNTALFQMNFTVAELGQTTIELCTYKTPAQLAPAGSAGWYTYALNSQQAAGLETGEADIFDYSNATLTVIVGSAVPPPFAFFTAQGTPVSNSTYLILNEMAPTQYPQYVSVQSNVPTYFNASGSYDKYGTIIAYIWNFSHPDGSDRFTDIVNTTGSPNDALLTHTFTHVGTYLATLTVVGQSGPNATQTSIPYTFPIVVNLAIPLYNWMPFIYTVIGLIAAAIVISVVRSAIRKSRAKRLRQQKLRRLEPSAQPQTGTKTT